MNVKCMLVQSRGMWILVVSKTAFQEERYAAEQRQAGCTQGTEILERE